MLYSKKKKEGQLLVKAIEYYNSDEEYSKVALILRSNKLFNDKKIM